MGEEDGKIGMSLAANPSKRYVLIKWCGMTPRSTQPEKFSIISRDAKWANMTLSLQRDIDGETKQL
jgi:hypothetical protein